MLKENLEDMVQVLEARKREASDNVRFAVPTKFFCQVTFQNVPFDSWEDISKFSGFSGFNHTWRIISLVIPMTEC